MLELDRMEKQFLGTLAELGDVLEKIVIVGGWCPFLYAKYLWQRPVPVIPTTLDIDLGVLETGVTRYPVTVYEKLKNAGYKIERIYPEEAEPIEFVSQQGAIELKVEFITSFLTSDDTLNRFLGKELACNRIEAFEILLENPLLLEIRHQGRSLKLKLPAPETYLFHKGISFVMRGDAYKLEKDLFYLYFILKFCPDRTALLAGLERFRHHQFFVNFRQNLLEYVASAEQPGYGMLRKFLGALYDPRSLNSEIKKDLAPLLRMIQKPAATA